MYRFTAQVMGKPMRGPYTASELSRILALHDGAAITPEDFLTSTMYNANNELIFQRDVYGVVKPVSVKRSTNFDGLQRRVDECNYRQRYKFLGGLLFFNHAFYSIERGVHHRVTGYHSVMKTTALRVFKKQRLLWFGPGIEPTDDEWKDAIKDHPLLGTSSLFTYHSDTTGRTLVMTWKWKEDQNVDQVLNNALDHTALEQEFIQDDPDYERRVPGENIRLDKSIIEFKRFGRQDSEQVGGGGVNNVDKKLLPKWYEVRNTPNNTYGLGEYDCLLVNILSQLPYDLMISPYDIVNYRVLWKIPEETYLTYESIKIVERELGVNVNVFLDEIVVCRKYSPPHRPRGFGNLVVESWSHKYYYQSAGYSGFTVNLVLHDDHYWELVNHKTISFSPLAAMAYLKSKLNNRDLKMPTKKQEMAFLFSLAAHGCDDAKKILSERRVPAFTVPIPMPTPLTMDDEDRLYPKYVKYRKAARSWLKSKHYESTLPDRWNPSEEFLETVKFRSIIFDVETIYDPEMANACRPYSMAYVVLEHDLRTGLPIFDYEGNEKEWFSKAVITTGYDCFDPLFDELCDNEKRATVLVGFNSSRFDNFMFVEELRKRGEHGEMFCAQNAILNIRWNGNTTFDAFNFVRTSLDFACKSYNTNPKKQSGFDHEIPQQAFHNGGWNGLMAWVEEEKIKLSEYNIMDVLSLADLYTKLGHVVQNCCDQNTRIYDYLTIGSLAYDVWKRMSNDDFIIQQERMGYISDTDSKNFEHIDWRTRSLYEYSNINVLPKFKYEDDMKMRKACTGGRVQIFENGGKPQSHDGEFAMVDVKSLYPFVMKTFDFPNGDIRYCFGEVPGALGVYRCKVMSQPAKRVVPRKIKDKPLDWHIEDNEPFERWLVTPDIECIRKYGGVVEVYEGYVFGGRGRVFEKYVNKFEKLKNQQDVWKDKKDSRYNPAEREFYKLILNNLSGKVMQRTFLDRAKLCLYRSQANQFVSTLDPASIDFGIINGAVLITGKVADMPKYGRMPSILGMYIYSYARNYMYDTLIHPYGVLYMDTDSALLWLAEYKRLLDERPDLFAEIMERAIKFGDLEEEVIFKFMGIPYPATHAVLLRPKSYMVFNPMCPEKCKMKLKGVGKRDRFLSSVSQVEIVKNLMKCEDYSALDQIYSTGSCLKLGINFSGCGNINCGQKDTFDSMFRERVGYFLCHSFLRKRSFSTNWRGDVGFNIIKRYVIKELRYDTDEILEHDGDDIFIDSEMDEYEQDMFVLDSLINET